MLQEFHPTETEPHPERIQDGSSEAVTKVIRTPYPIHPFNEGTNGAERPM
jgi:hypothetical protein